MMSNQRQNTPSPLANRSNENGTNAAVDAAQKKLDVLLDKNYNNNNNNNNNTTTTNNNNNNNNNERGREEETRQSPAIGQNDPGGRRVGSGSTASWSLLELDELIEESVERLRRNPTPKLFLFERVPGGEYSQTASDIQIKTVPRNSSFPSSV